MDYTKCCGGGCSDVNCKHCRGDNTPEYKAFMDGGKDMRSYILGKIENQKRQVTSVKQIVKNLEDELYFMEEIEKIIR